MKSKKDPRTERAIAYIKKHEYKTVLSSPMKARAIAAFYGVDVKDLIEEPKYYRPFKSFRSIKKGLHIKPISTAHIMIGQVSWISALYYIIKGYFVSYFRRRRAIKKICS